MDLAQKNRIVKRYINEISVNPSAVALQDEDLEAYAVLGALLDHIDANNNGLFNLSTLEIDERQWNDLKYILKRSTTFNPGSPPVINSYSLKDSLFAIQYLQNKYEIEALPKDDFYSRPAIKRFATEDDELNSLIEYCSAKLYALTQTFPGISAFNSKDIDQINLLITLLEEQIKKLTDANAEKEILQKQLNILLDLKKITLLECMNIRQDDGASSTYCTLAEPIEGVTEKISLISLDSVKTSLRRLHNRASGLTTDDYSNERDQYKLSIQAMIKLPKHGDIKEIQHEAMALNISRMLRRDDSTSQSTTISYQGRPALFIPFANIRLLSDFTSGKTFTAGLGIKGTTYTHYSTIKPIGEGIQADRFIEDFGNALGLLYLCSDTDAIGGYCQNKALRDAHSLFIFDQVIMEANKFVLDSRMSLKPDALIMKHTRHGKGRNRTVIEDSLMDSKYASIIQLKEMNNKILQYAEHVAQTHEAREKQINQLLRKEILEQERTNLVSHLKDVISLKNDALHLKDKMEERISAIDNVLPKTTGTINSTELRQALIFEKLLHNPKLFSDDGRPYKNPWTERQKNNLKQIDDIGNGTVQLTFSNAIADEMVHFIKRRGGGDSIGIIAPKTITITKMELAALREDLLHPEHQLTINHKIDYLDSLDLDMLKNAYSEGNQEPILAIITDYQRQISRTDLTATQKINHITQAKTQLDASIATARDKGFGKHILKKFYFDVQQKLHLLIAPLLRPVTINTAFTSALKLDRVVKFTTVVAEAIKCDKANDPRFLSFLEECIRKADAATNYIEAQRESKTLSIDVKKTIRQLKTSPIPVPALAGLFTLPKEDELLLVNPLVELEKNLTDEYNILIKKQKVNITESAPTAVLTPESLQIGITRT